MLADRGHPSHGTAPCPTSLTPDLYPGSQEVPPRGCSHREHQSGETTIAVGHERGLGRLRPLLPSPSSSNPTAWMGDRPAHLRSPVLEPPGNSFLTHLLSACSIPGTVPGLRVQPRTKQTPVLLGLPFRRRERGQYRADRWMVLQRRAGQRGEALSLGREGSARPRQGGPRRANGEASIGWNCAYRAAFVRQALGLLLQGWSRPPRDPPHLACPLSHCPPTSGAWGSR